VRRSSCRKQGVEADGRSCVRVHRVLGVRTHHPPNRRSPTARAHERSRAAAGTAAQPRRAGVAACTWQLEARTGGRWARTRKMAHDDRVRGRSRCFYSRYRDGADAQTGCASRELELTRFRLPRTFRCTSRPATINVGLSEAAPYGAADVMHPGSSLRYSPLALGPVSHTCGSRTRWYPH